MDFFSWLFTTVGYFTSCFLGIIIFILWITSHKNSSSYTSTVSEKDKKMIAIPAKILMILIVLGLFGGTMYIVLDSAFNTNKTKIITNDTNSSKLK